MGAVLIKLKRDRLLKVQYFDRHGEADGGAGWGCYAVHQRKNWKKKLPQAALMHLPETLSSSETDAYLSLTQITTNSNFSHPYQTKLKRLISDN